MAIILNIDTATERASVCISNGKSILGEQMSQDQKNHASFIQPAIQQLCTTTGMALTNIDAVSVTAGPGSYTGLRVGMSTAKGICYALQKPLITVNTLLVMTKAASLAHPEATVYCPLIDARRMEVFTALYDQQLGEILTPQAMILGPASFADILEKEPVCFFGSGSQKLKEILISPNARFSKVQHNASHLALLALESFATQAFADIAYSEPFYIKPFFDGAKA